MLSHDTAIANRDLVVEYMLNAKFRSSTDELNICNHVEMMQR